MKREMIIAISVLMAISLIGCGGGSSSSDTARIDIPISIGGSNVKVEIIRPIPSYGELHQFDKRVTDQIKKFIESSDKEIIAVTTHTKSGHVVGAEVYYR